MYKKVMYMVTLMSICIQPIYSINVFISSAPMDRASLLTASATVGAAYLLARASTDKKVFDGNSCASTTATLLALAGIGYKVAEMSRPYLPYGMFARKSVSSCNELGYAAALWLSYELVRFGLHAYEKGSIKEGFKQTLKIEHDYAARTSPSLNMVIRTLGLAALGLQIMYPGPRSICWYEWRIV